MEEAKEMIYHFDKDDDGAISFSEFVQMMMYDTMDQTLYQNAKWVRVHFPLKTAISNLSLNPSTF